MAALERVKQRISAFKLPTFRQALRWLGGLPLRLLKFILRLPLNLVKFIIYLPRNIWKAWTAGAKGIVRLEKWAVIGWGHAKEARRWQRLHLPRSRILHRLYTAFHPRHIWHGMRARRDALRRPVWDLAPGLGAIPQSLKWARQQRRHRSRFTDIDALRSILYANDTLLTDDPLKPSVGYLGRRTSVSRRWGTLLHGLVRFGEAQRVVTVGTGYGIANLYLARGLVENYPLHTCMLVALETDPDRARHAEKDLQRLGYSDFAEVRKGDSAALLPKALKDTAPVNLVFIDGEPAPDDLLRMVSQVKHHSRPGALIVITGIHTNRTTRRTWDTIRAMPGLAATLDLWQWGILITGKGPAIQLSARL